jgi:hypothetical protein
METYSRGNFMYKDLVGYEDYYSISNCGDILSKRTDKAMKQFVDNRGYYRCTLSDSVKPRTLLVHRLVAKTFIENPDNLYTVNHINGIKTDNRVENLEWMSLEDNVRHAYEVGLTSSKGSNNNNSKFLEKDILEIRRLFETEGLSNSQISTLFSVDSSTIRRITSYRAWSHLSRAKSNELC